MAGPVKKTTGNLKGAGPGRPKGMQNKTTTALKEAILQAGENAGEADGLVGYLTWLAKAEASSFASLLGRVLPHTIAGDPNAPFVHQIIERVIVRPPNTNG